jgi:FkbM family methyltransferase
MWPFLLLGLVVFAVARHCYVRFIVRPGTIRERTLPNGMKAFGCSGDLFEDFVYRENFVDRTYLSHGITVDSKSTVLDVGANIGLFTMSLLKAYPGIRIHCIEPVPVLYNACRQNAARTARAPEDVVCHNVALGDSEGSVPFRYNAQASATSGMFKTSAVLIPRSRRVTSWLAAVLDDGVLGGVLPGFVKVLPPILRAPVVGPVVAIVLIPVWVVLGIFHFAGQLPAQKFDAKITTLDSIIKNHNIEKADLVKVDVEGAELMVMKSISKEAFSRIKQIVIEVHDIDDRTNVLTSMLREHGFNVKKSERESLETQNLFRLDTLYAVRP